MNTQVVSVRIDPELLEYLKSRAKEENRTLSNMIVSIMMEEQKKTLKLKVWVTKTSDWDYGEMREYTNMEECINDLLKEKYTNNQPDLVVSRVLDCYPEEAKQCDFNVEIYDTWRE